MMWLPLLIALAVTHLVVIAVFVAAVAIPNPLRSLIRHGRPSERGLDAEDVRLDNGSPGWLVHHPTSRDAVLVCHGRSRDKSWMLPLVETLTARHNVLVFDFPAHGENRFARTSIGLHEADTVHAALRWLGDAGFDRVVVYGVSMGGAASIIALGRYTPEFVTGLVTDGTFDRLERVFGGVEDRIPLPNYVYRTAEWVASRIVGVHVRDVRPVEYVHNVRVPCLFLHGDRDPLVPPVAAAHLEEHAGGDATSRIYRGTHDDPRNETMQAHVVRFADEHLG